MTDLSNFLLSKLFRLIGQRYFSSQIAICLSEITRRRNARIGYIPADLDLLVTVLVIAEDRRFFHHCGVDMRGVIRAIFVYLLRRKIQGASTITQQLVRVVISDYQRSVRRKMQEICIAVELDRMLSKTEQAILYLEVGYYGWRMSGLIEARERLRISTPCSKKQAAEIVARLKYPEPEFPSEVQTKKIQRRVAHIVGLLEEHGNEA